jgi:para-nitrobenzyl esterase
MEAAKSQKDVTLETSFAWQTWTWARLQSYKGTNKAYVYYFDRRNPFTPDGAGHGAEASYVFGNFSGPVAGAGSGAQKLSKIIQSYWVNFAKSGNPNGEGLPEWPAFTVKEQNAMIFADSVGARQLPNLEKLKVFEPYYAGRRAEASARAAGSK